MNAVDVRFDANWANAHLAPHVFHHSRTPCLQVTVRFLFFIWEVMAMSKFGTSLLYSLSLLYIHAEGER